MVKITIDSIEADVPAGLTILQACDMIGIEIPRFCFHERLSIAGNCRMCLVEIEGGPPKPMPSCAMQVTEGMVIRTKTKKIEKARKGVLEFLLINHPLDCPVCDQGGECDLQDQAFFYGCGRSRFNESKRIYKKTDFGPLISDCMNRCIHCRRCTRFLSEVAGCNDLGSIGRGNNSEISTYVQKYISSEVSGNIIDLCPVGALTSKPYLFKCRPWDLSRCDTIDVLDAVCSSIRVDSFNLSVVRVLPRENDSLNEEWISDRTRFAYDGLSINRLDKPYIKKNGSFVDSSWSNVLHDVCKIKSFEGSRMAAIAGCTADVESMFLLKMLMNGLGCGNIDCRENGAFIPSDKRYMYLFNTTMQGIEEADLCILVGANPRKEAAILDLRIRKGFRNGMKIFSIGDYSGIEHRYTVQNIGDSPLTLLDIASGTHPLCSELSKAKKPMLIVGQSLLKRSDASGLLSVISKICSSYGFMTSEWSGFNILHEHANCIGGMDIGFLPMHGAMPTKKIVEAAKLGTIDFLYLLNADILELKDIHPNVFVIYQGHHGDVGAGIADIILPGHCFTEKCATYVNLEGRTQMTDIAIQAPDGAREDWKIINDIMQNVLQGQFFYDLGSLRKEIALLHGDLYKDFTGQKHYSDFCQFPLIDEKINNNPITIENKSFYVVDPITRNSKNMQECYSAFEHNIG